MFRFVVCCSIEVVLNEALLCHPISPSCLDCLLLLWNGSTSFMALFPVRFD